VGLALTSPLFQPRNLFALWAVRSFSAYSVIYRLLLETQDVEHGHVETTFSAIQSTVAYLIWTVFLFVQLPLRRDLQGPQYTISERSSCMPERLSAVIFSLYPVHLRYTGFPFSNL